MIGDSVAGSSGVRAGARWLAVAAAPVGSAAPAPLASSADTLPLAPPQAISNVITERRDHDRAGSPRPDAPPNWVYVPGHSEADSDYLLPYPGLQIADGMIGALLAHRYRGVHGTIVHTGRRAYAELVRLGAGADEGTPTG